MAYPLNPRITAAPEQSGSYIHLQWDLLSENERECPIALQRPREPNIEICIGRGSTTNTHLNEVVKTIHSTVSENTLTSQPSHDTQEPHTAKAPSIRSGKEPRSCRSKRVSEKTIQKKQVSSRKVTRPEPVFPEVIRFNENGVRVVDVIDNKECLDDSNSDFGRVLRLCHILIRVQIGRAHV